MEAADEGRQHVRGLEVEVVAGPVQVRRHRRDPAVPVLGAECLDVEDARDLGHGVGLVRRLQRAGHQRGLPDRLRGVAGVDAGGAEEEQPLYPAACAESMTLVWMSRLSFMNSHRVRRVRHDPADAGGRVDDDVGLRLEDGVMRGHAVAQVEPLDRQPMISPAPAASRARTMAEPTSPLWPAT